MSDWTWVMSLTNLHSISLIKKSLYLNYSLTHPIQILKQKKMSNNNFIRIISTLILVFIFSFELLNAQSLSIKWEKEQPYHKRGQTLAIEIIKHDQQSILYKVTSTKMVKEREFIVKNNRTTGENKYFDIVNKLKWLDFAFNSVNLANGEFEIISEIHSFKTNEVQRYQQFVDTANLLPKTARVKLSNNEKKNIVSKPIFITENFETYGQKNISVYTKDKYGNYYTVNRKFDNKKDRKNFTNSITSLVFLPKDNGSPVYLSLQLPNNCFISSYQLAINGKEEIVCTGLYAKEGLQSAMGCYSFIVSPGLTEIKSFDIKEFPKELILKGLDKKDSQDILDKIDSNKEFEDNTIYLSSKIHYNKDGSYNLAIEKYKLELETNNKTLKTTYHHYFQDIYVLNFDTDGKIKWMQKIPRYAYVIDNASFAGNYYLKYDDNDNMYFIFNLIHTNKTFGILNNSKTVCVKLDTKGNEKFSELESNTEVSQYICPTFFTDDGPDSVIAIKLNYNVVLEGTGSSKNTITFGELKLK